MISATTASDAPPPGVMSQAVGAVPSHTEANVVKPARTRKR